MGRYQLAVGLDAYVWVSDVPPVTQYFQKSTIFTHIIGNFQSREFHMLCNIIHAASMNKKCNPP